ncbi:MAG: GtrA family protein [Gemmiger sp.]|uniref:GtrA family protein n=1 Tax=Gemmiger sp. TaxID=2049027 RepID=UPI002A91ED69|nr:GtrA family protein [Gemmiger sp.]MDY5325750.1 GtrA family protein [Gemmiger sp.]
MKPGKYARWGAALLQFVKFGIVGVSNTAISYGIEMLCYYVLFMNVPWSESVRILATSVLAFVVSVTNSYYWNNRYVFGSGTKKTVRQHLTAYLKTVACYGVTGLLLAPAIKVYVTALGVPYWLSSLGALVVTIPLNFILNKFWAFRKSGGSKE